MAGPGPSSGEVTSCEYGNLGNSNVNMGTMGGNIVVERLVDCKYSLELYTEICMPLHLQVYAEGDAKYWVPIKLIFINIFRFGQLVKVL
jgi:hypothetical protein